MNSSEFGVLGCAVMWVFQRPRHPCRCIHSWQSRLRSGIENHLTPRLSAEGQDTSMCKHADRGPSAARSNSGRVLAKTSPHRFGFHNLRHSLASFLVRTRTDPKTVQNLLRHSNVKTTLQLYAHSVTEDRMAAQGLALAAFLEPPSSGTVN
jgi:integrase